MADQRITQLTALPEASLAATDVLPIADISASETKKITAKDLVEGAIALADSGSIDLAKLNQSSATQLGTSALADDAVTAAKLANDSATAVQASTPSTDNFKGRGYYNSDSGNLQVFNGAAYQQVVLPTAGIGDLQVTTSKLADGAVTTAKVTALDTAAYADSSVTTAKIADGAITAAKIAADSITANEIASDAVGASELANDAVDTAAIVDLAVSEAKIAPAAIATAKLANLAVTNDKIAETTIAYSKLNLADGSVPGAKIAADSITSAQLGAASVDTSELVDGAVITAKLANNAVTAGKIAVDTITANEIASGAIGTSELAGASVTYDKIQNTTATNVVIGRSTAGAGSVEEISCTAAGRALIGGADAATQRATLGLGTVSTGNGSWADGSIFSGNSSGTNTGDQTIALTGAVTGTGTGTFATALATNAVTETAIATDAVTTSKINATAVTAAKLANNSAAVVAASSPAGSGIFIGQQWINTNTGQEFTWTGSAWLLQAGIGTLNIVDTTPVAIAVTYPDAYSATLTVTLDTQAAATVLSGPASGVDSAPTFRAIVPSDLPNATVSTKGIIQPGTGLEVTAGTLNHANAVSGATVSSITFDNQGHITAAAPLAVNDIPALDTSKITTGTFSSAFIAADSVTGVKLADYATAKFGEALPIADYIGQFFFNPLDKNIYLWDGNVWQPVGVSIGELVFGGTYNANTNLIVSTTTVGSAAGLTAGQALPAAAAAFVSYYVVVSTSGTGTAPAPTVALAPPDIILCDGTAWKEIDVSSTYTAQTASNVGFVPAGTIGSTNTQSAIEEVASEAANAANLTSGLVAVARGGTAIGSYTKGDLLAASASTTLTKLGVGSNGQVLRANSATATGLEWGTNTAGSVTSVSSSTAALTIVDPTTTPALTIRTATTSVNGIVQLSDSTSTTSSVLAATPTAVKAAYDLAALALPRAGGIITGDLEIGNTGNLVFEGATVDGFETILTAADPTADQTVTLPNLTGTIALTSQLNDGTY